MKDLSNWLADLNSDNPRKKVSALISTLQFETPTTEHIVHIEALLWDKYVAVCQAALDTLGYLSEQHGLHISIRALDRVYELTAVEPAKLRADAIANLALLIPIHSRERRIATLTKGLVDNEAIVRQFAASALGDLKATESIKELNNALLDSDPDTQFEAAIAMSRLRAGNDQVLKILEHSLDVTSRRALAAESLAYLNDSRAIPSLRKTSLRIFISWSDRTAIHAAMSALGDELALSKLLARVLNAWSQAERVYGIALLGKYELRGAAPTLKKIALGRRRFDQLSAIKALGDLGDDRNIGFLRDIMESSDDTIKEAAQAALDKLKT